MADHSLITDANRLLTYIFDETEGREDVEVDIDPFLETADWSDDHAAEISLYVTNEGLAYEFNPSAAHTDEYGDDVPANPIAKVSMSTVGGGWALTAKGIEYVNLLPT